MTTITTNTNKPTRKDRLRLIASGVQKHFPSGQMVLAGQTFNLPTDLVNALQADIQVTDAADKARADWMAAVQVQQDSHQKVAPVLRAFKGLVLAQFGESQNASSTLADFGFEPPKSTVKSAADKATAAEKGRATRTARHTLGKNQKKLVKGTVPAAVSPPVTPASPPAAPTPLASVPSAGVVTAGGTPHVG